MNLINTFANRKGRAEYALSVLLFCLAGFPFLQADSAPQDPGLARAEKLYKKRLWADAEKAFLDCASHAPKTPFANAALCKAGHCRLGLHDDKGAEALFERVVSDPAALKDAPEPVADAFDQLHILFLKRKNRPAREKLIRRCRAALPGAAVNARIAEREGDARLETGATEKALSFYDDAGAGLSPAGTNAVRLLRPPRLKGRLGLPPLSESDAAVLAAVAAAKPACGIALCRLLAGRGEGWRAEDVLARLDAHEKKYDDAIKIWESLLKSGRGPADRIGLAVAETVGFKKSDFPRALLLYEGWLKAHPSSPLREKAEYQHAGVLWAAGRLADAVAAFTAFLARYPSGCFCGEAEKMLVHVKADLACRLAAEKKTAAAVGGQLASDLDSAEALVRDGRYADALHLFARFRGRQYDPLWGRAWYGYGVSLRALDEPGRALSAWDEVVRQAALFTNTLCAAESRRARADTLFGDLAEPERALSEYRAIRADLSPEAEDPALEKQIALSLLALGRGEEARPVFEAFRKKESSDPLRVRYWDGLISLCGRPATAAAARPPGEREAARLCKVADVQFASGVWNKAAALYFKASRSAPGSETAAWSQMQRGRCLARLNKFSKALNVYDTFKKEYSKSAWADDALLRAGVLCAGPLGDARRGENYFREILEEHPGGDRAETAFLYLATLAWWNGEWTEAERLNKAFLEKYPDSPLKEEILTARLPAIAKKSCVAETPGPARREGTEK